MIKKLYDDERRSVMVVVDGRCCCCGKMREKEGWEDRVLIC